MAAGALCRRLIADGRGLPPGAWASRTEKRCCNSPPLPERRGVAAICGVVGWRFAGQGIANGDGGIGRGGGILWLNDDGGDSPLAARGRKTRRSRRMAKTENVPEWQKCVSGSIFSTGAYRIATRSRVPGFCSSENLAGAGRKRRPGGQERAFSVGERRRAESCKSLWDKGLCVENKKASRWSPGGFWILGGARNRIRTCDLYRVKIAF